MELIDGTAPELDGWTHEDRWDRAWISDAACLASDLDSEAWFATDDAIALQKAKRVCMECPVRADCLNYALTHDEQHGVWGGLDEDRRERLRRSLRLPRPHGTHARYQQHIKVGEDPCAACKRGHADYKNEWIVGAHRLDHLEAVGE